MEWFPESKSLSCAITPTSLIPSWCFSCSSIWLIGLFTVFVGIKTHLMQIVVCLTARRSSVWIPACGLSMWGLRVCPMSVCVFSGCSAFQKYVYWSDLWAPHGGAPQSWVQCNAEIQFYSTLCCQFKKYLLKYVIDSVCWSAVWIVI